MYLRMTSDVYGSEDFGPYDNRKQATEAMERIVFKAARLADGIERWFRIITNKEHDESD